MTQFSNTSTAEIVASVTQCLDTTDDAALWQNAVEVILQDAEFLCQHASGRTEILTQIGACSHWQRPHQTRWTADGGFAAPLGYGDQGGGGHALPEFDWSQTFHWQAELRRWHRLEEAEPRRRLLLRIALPTRTMLHDQAAIHTLWTPGAPTIPAKKSLRLYGFRKDNGQWRCTATAGDEAPYEATIAG